MIDKLHLKRPLVFFDTETTGVNIVKDRIIELCAIKVYPAKSDDIFLQRFNPGIPIEPGATKVHGITDEMVAHEPPFSDKAAEIAEFFSDCDLAGYNLIKFDVPLLVEELLRNGITKIPFEGASIIDCLAIWRKMEPRTLSDAVRYYTNGIHEDAHSALADVEATMKVLTGQLEKYADLVGDPVSLHEIVNQGVTFLDYDRKFSRDEDGDIIYTFGSNRGKKVKDNYGMLEWMLPRDFTEHTKYMPEEEKKKIQVEPLEAFLFPEEQDEGVPEEEIDPNKITLPDSESVPMDIKAVGEIEEMAEDQNRKMEEEIEKQAQQPVDENIYQEMGDKVKRYRIIEAHQESASKIHLPQFFLTVPQSDIFGTDKILLNQESLLKDFKLSSEDSKIDFTQIDSDLYKVDVEEIAKGEYSPRYTKIEDMQVKDPIVDYILAKPKENQIKDIAHQLVLLVGDMYPIPDQEIRSYIERILNDLNAEQLQDVLMRKWSYAVKVKDKIRAHTDKYAESKFNDLIKVGKVTTDPTWVFPDLIVPGQLGPSIGNSLYKHEGSMNTFEATVITDIASLPNLAFWHRNLGRGKGFAINGFKSNHYPDFILVSKSGKVILLETKGDDRDNSDSEAKCRLGNKWAEVSGKDFSYFMVFDKKEVPGSYTVTKAKELIKQL